MGRFLIEFNEFIIISCWTLLGDNNGILLLDNEEVISFLVDNDDDDVDIDSGIDEKGEINEEIDVVITLEEKLNDDDDDDDDDEEEDDFDDCKDDDWHRFFNISIADNFSDWIISQELTDDCSEDFVNSLLLLLLALLVIVVLICFKFNNIGGGAGGCGMNESDLATSTIWCCW